MKRRLLLFFLFISSLVTAQNNIYRSGGITQTVGAPTFTPGASGNIVAIDTVTGEWYVNPNRLSGASWIRSSIDGELIQMVCEQVDERGRLRTIVLQDAQDWRSRRALRELDRQIASMLGQLGFSPTDRAGLGIGDQKNHDFIELHRRIQAKRQA